MEFEKLEKSIGYKFKNKELLINALTHTSYAYEKNVPSNEKLEFLGDIILEFISSKYLYNNMGSKETISKEIIKLPVDYNGNPDWKYMNNYIDNLEQIELNTLNKMKAIF